MCAVAGFVLVAAGCNVDARVDIVVHDDGSGVVRTTVRFDSDAVRQLGGESDLAGNVPLGDLRGAGWTISKWTRASDGSESVTLSSPFANQAQLAQRVVDLAGKHGILQSPTLSHSRGWFNSRDEFAVVVDVRAPSVDVVDDGALVARLRAAGVDPSAVQSQLSSAIGAALHVSLVVHLPDGHTETYVIAPGTLRKIRVTSGGTNWDHVVKFGLGLALVLVATMFFLAAGIGARRNRRRTVERSNARAEPERVPLS